MRTFSIISMIVGGLMVVGQAASADPYYGPKGESGGYDRHVFYDFLRNEKTEDLPIESKWTGQKANPNSSIDDSQFINYHEFHDKK